MTRRQGCSRWKAVLASNQRRPALRAGAIRIVLACIAAICALLCGAATASGQTVVSLTFDDGIATQMLTRPLLISHGMKGTFHINSGTVGDNSYYMTWSNVD